MKKVSFIGAYDNIDFVLYVAKLLTHMGKKVLIIDGTITQKAKYIVPTMSPSRTYVTEFEDIDVAVGFRDYEDIKDYLGIEDFEYDIAMVNVDNPDTVSSFEIEYCDINYFVTSSDNYSIKKGLEAISVLYNPIEATKILYSKDMTKEENDYIDYLAEGSKIEWTGERIYLPFELGDQSVIYENQRVAKIKYKRLSNQYKEQLLFVTEQISKLFDDIDVGKLRKEFKKIEKGV